MIRFPFIVNKRKAVVIEASSLSNAIDRVTTKHPNKWIRTKHARNVQKHINQQSNMDLINAQKEALKLSKLKKKELVYVILEEDEFRVTQDVDIDKDDIYSTWRGGAKIDSPHENKLIEEKENKESKTENKMETKTKKSAKKTAVKKVATKKIAKKAIKKANGTARKFEPGKVLSISIADMRAKMKKGFYYRDPQGVRQTENYMKTRAKQDYVREGMHEYKEEK